MSTGHDTLLETPRNQAAADILACYAMLAEQGKHLLSSLLSDRPRQWAHCPDNDVIDRRHGFQYFYHSHAPEDRPDASEHGHFHLFARIDDSSHTVDFAAEHRFLEAVQGAPAVTANTVNLLCIGLDAKGVPNTLFTVNRWVTGDHLLSASATLRLLSHFRVAAKEYDLVNRWLAAMVQLFWPQIETLLLARDVKLVRLAKASGRASILDDESAEVLSLTSIDLDRQIAELLIEA